MHSGTNSGTLLWTTWAGIVQRRRPARGILPAPSRKDADHVAEASFPIVHRCFRSPVRIMRTLLLCLLVLILFASTRPARVFAQNPAVNADQVTLAPGDSVRVV